MEFQYNEQEQNISDKINQLANGLENYVVRCHTKPNIVNNDHITPSIAKLKSWKRVINQAIDRSIKELGKNVCNILIFVFVEYISTFACILLQCAIYHSITMRWKKQTLTTKVSVIKKRMILQ